MNTSEQCVVWEQSIRWQPITTAPRDGTFVIVAGDSGYLTTPLRAEICRSSGGAWRNHANDLFTDGGADPLYWIPLPTL
jgi:hypothetical protein